MRVLINLKACFIYVYDPMIFITIIIIRKRLHTAVNLAHRFSHLPVNINYMTVCDVIFQHGSDRFSGAQYRGGDVRFENSVGYVGG